MLLMQKFLTHVVDSMLNPVPAYRLKRPTSPILSSVSGAKEASQVTDFHVNQPPHHVCVSMGLQHSLPSPQRSVQNRSMSTMVGLQTLEQ